MADNIQIVGNILEDTDINDLFDGSSEMFSEAIKMLDSQTALDVANEKAAQLAVQHSWDPEEEVVVEFMSFVNRRYA